MTDCKLALFTLDYYFYLASQYSYHVFMQLADLGHDSRVVDDLYKGLIEASIDFDTMYWRVV